MSRWRSIGWSAVVALAGCGGDVVVEEAETETDTSGQENTQAEVSAEPTTWAEMNPEQRKAYMRETVMPEMKALFQQHDAERYADFGCATCHMENMQEVGFAMPNGLAPLDPARIPDIFRSEDPTAVFMTQTVWPRMAELLDQPLYSPEAGEGFGCLGCHAAADPAAAK